MRRLAAGAFALALAALPAAARADLFSSISYGAHASTTGFGVTLEKPLLYNFSLRLLTNNLSVTEQETYDATHYTATTHVANIGLIGDFRPYAGRYRISAGLLFGSDRIDNVAQPGGATINVGTGVYPVAGTGQVTTHLRFDRPAIYAGVGTGTGLVPGLALAFDAGIEIRNGHADASATGPLAGDPTFQADLARLQGELRTRVISPVVSIGLVYRP
jgi:hypothetical protein